MVPRVADITDPEEAVGVKILQHHVGEHLRKWGANVQRRQTMNQVDRQSPRRLTVDLVQVEAPSAAQKRVDRAELVPIICRWGHRLVPRLTTVKVMLTVKTPEAHAAAEVRRLAFSAHVPCDQPTTAADAGLLGWDDPSTMERLAEGHGEERRRARALRAALRVRVGNHTVAVGF